MPSRDKPRGGVALQSAAVRDAGPPKAEAAPPPPPAAPRAPQQPASKPGGQSRRALKNWRVRSRLLLLITIPTLTAVVLGGFRIVTSVQSALTYQRIEQLAHLSSDVTKLAAGLADERDQTTVYSAEAQATPGSPHVAAQLALVHQLQLKTNAQLASVRRGVATIGAAYPAQIRQDAAAVKFVVRNLPVMRKAALNENLGPLVVMEAYGSSIDYLIAVSEDIALDSADPTLSSDVRALGLVSRIHEQSSQQRALLAYALAQRKFSPDVLSAFITAQSQAASYFHQFTDSALPAQTALYDNTVSGGAVELADGYEQQAVAHSTDLPASITEPGWYSAMSAELGKIRQVENKLVAGAVARASTLRRNAIIDAIAVGAAVIIVLGLALVLTSLVGRSMVRPLRRLRAGALEVAGLQLPETVRRMSESDGSGVPVTAAPIDVDSVDEIGEVARAFDQVHREALRLAANEAALRGNVNAMFVNLSRRSQSLVERQIRLIDELEQGEQDAERLGSLFQMDHLATRMRRNSENLLVLAGHDSSRRWNQPVALVDVLRAAVSEIEQYERVSLNVQPGISVRGHAVNDVVHLLAELAENATSFSSAETPVTVSGHLLSSGGVLLDITDQGVGMGAEEMAHANWRLDNPPVVDVAVSRRMGLFVVARLAARHGVRVRLRPAASGGLTALVWLPDEVVSREGASPSGSRLPDAPAEAINVSMPGPSGHNGEGTDERWATAQEVNAARTPKFAPLESAGAENGGSLGPLGPQRVPGSGPRPGASPWDASTTGPQSAFPTSPQPAGEAAGEPFATAPQPAVGSGAPGGYGGQDQPVREPAGSDLSSNGFSDPDFGSGGFSSPGRGAPPGLASTGPLPAVDRETWGSWPEPPAATSPAGQGTDSQPSPAEPVAAVEPAAAAERAAAPLAEAQLSDRQAADSPDSPASAASPADGSIGTGQKLPKRKVDRDGDSRDIATPRTASTDMFSVGGGRGSGGFLRAGSQPGALGDSAGPSDPGQPAAAESAEPAEPAQPEVLASGTTNGSNAANGSFGSHGSNGSNGAGGASAASASGAAASSAGALGASSGFGWDAGSSADQVVVPPAELGTEYRLPIFEAVESDWFRRGRSSVGWAPQEQEQEQEQEASPEQPAWTSPADEGWQAAAAAVAAPSSSGVTPAGLPKRVPKANLVPGSAGAPAASEASAAPPPVRSAAATRDRFSSFQRGIRDGRAAAGGDNPAGEDDGSR
ncbi:MAG TPA: nitrate- and nitrite sensing domain-containing protein [Streptosporangiaceae bacterium]